jgi:hypothetical protein
LEFKKTYPTRDALHAQQISGPGFEEALLRLVQHVDLEFIRGYHDGGKESESDEDEE